MKIGIIRKVDEVGRIVIPKEIRKTLGIEEGSRLEICPQNNSIILRKSDDYICNKCGQLVDKQDKYCRNCGRSLKDDARK